MKNDGISQVAKRMGVSKSTVSKAVNHCMGVGCEIRAPLLAAAREQGLTGKYTAACDVYVILPEIPRYFWGAVMDALRSALQKQGLLVKYNITSRLDDAATVAHYLDEVEELSPGVVIIAADVVSLADRLPAIARQCAVFSLCETMAPTNVFYFGGSGAEDGRLMVRRLRDEHPSVQRVLLLGGNDARRSGFLEEAAGLMVHSLPLKLDDTAAQLARTLANLRPAFPFEAVVCLDGVTNRVSLALKKCRADLPCYGFEFPVIDSRCDVPRGEVVQDIRQIAGRLAKAAANYVQTRTLPERKMNFVPSTYLRREAARTTENE